MKYLKTFEATFVFFLAIVRILLLYEKVIHLMRALICYIAETYSTKIERDGLNFKGEHFFYETNQTNQICDNHI